VANSADTAQKPVSEPAKRRDHAGLAENANRISSVVDCPGDRIADNLLASTPPLSRPARHAPRFAVVAAE